MSSYDPEPFILSKKQMITVIDDVINYLMKDPFGNARALKSVVAFRVWLMTVNDLEIGRIFSLIIRFIDLLRFHNVRTFDPLMRNLSQVDSELLKPRSIVREIFGKK